MTTFIFGDYIYETPIFVIKALKKAEIPEALEQMEKLRRTSKGNCCPMNVCCQR